MKTEKRSNLPARLAPQKKIKAHYGEMTFVDTLTSSQPPPEGIGIVKDPVVVECPVAETV